MADRAFNSYPGAPLIAGNETLLIAQDGVTLNTTPDQILQAGLVPTFGDTTVRNLIFTANQSVSNVLAAPTATPGVPVWRQLSTDDIGGMGVFFSSPPPIGDVTPNTGAFTALSGLVTATGSPTARTLADRAADWVNVKDYGAKLDGTTVDTAAIAAAYAAAGDNGTIFAPAGGWNASAPTQTAGKEVLWHLTGNCFGTGTTPVTGIGTDVVETFFGGTKFFGRGSSTASIASSLVRIDHKMTHTGGTSGATKSGLLVNTTVSSNVADYGWGVTSTLHSTSNGGGQHLALAGYAYKDADGDPVWGSNIYAYDTTGHASSVSGQIVAEEISVIASGGLDDSGAASALIPAGAGTRVGIDLIGQQGPNPVSTAEIGWVLRVGARSRGIQPAGPWSSSEVYAKRVISTLGAFSIAAVDTSLATAMGSANAFRMAAGQTFAFDGTTNSRTLGYVTADTALEYKVAGTTRFSISDVGMLTAPAANFASALASSPTPALKTGGNINTAAGAFQQAFNSQIGFVSGAMPNASNLLNVIQTQSDFSSTAGENINLGVYYTIGGASFEGARANTRFVFVFDGDSTNPTANTFHRNVAITTAARAIDGGTATLPNSNWFGIINDVALQTGALHWNSLCGLEIDTSIEAGASAESLIGLQIVQKATHVTKAGGFNTALSITNQTNGAPPGYDTAITFGAPNGVWAPTTTMIGTTPTALSGPAYAAVNGIDFSAVTFSGSAFKSTGFSVDGSGVVIGSALATGGTTARTLAAIFADQNNVKSFGAVGDGTTVDLAALLATPAPAYLPTGTFYTGASIFSQSAGRWTGAEGGGVLAFLESGITRQGPRDLAVITSAPVLNPGYAIGGLNTAFDGDFSNVHNVQATRITGAATLGTPTTGFQNNYAAGMGLFFLLNQSGHNESLSSNIGRTQVATHTFISENFGQGDQAAILFTGLAKGTQVGATSYLANSAVSGIAGTFSAAADGVALKPIGDLNLLDVGFDVTGHPFVTNMTRTNGTGALGTSWMAIRPQSIGSVAIDGMYCGVGLVGIGADYTGMVLQDRLGTTTNAALTLAAGMRIFGNSTNTDPSRFSRYTTLGTEWLSYETATGWGFVVGSASVFNANATAVTASKNLIRKAATADQSADVYVATAAGSRTIPNACSWECLTPAGTIATFTTTMPAAPIDKQEVWISTTNTITTWTLSPNTGQTINGAPTTLGANTSVQFRYNLATTTWFRML